MVATLSRVRKETLNALEQFIQVLIGQTAKYAHM